jgi:hypothetical protein
MSDQKLDEVKLFHGQQPTLRDHLEAVKHLEGDSQLELWIEGIL